MDGDADGGKLNDDGHCGHHHHSPLTRFPSFSNHHLYLCRIYSNIFAFVTGVGRLKPQALLSGAAGAAGTASLSAGV